MLVVLDANEYIFGLGSERKYFCEKLLDVIFGYSSEIGVRLCRLIFEEVRNNLTPEAFKEFIGLIGLFTIVDEDITVPFELGIKYELQGLKPADAFIAAYTEWVGADILVTENRHFLSRQSELPFKVLTAEKCLKFIIRTS